MAAPYLDLASKFEAALKSVVDALSLTDSASAAVPCFTGLDDDNHATPCVVVKCDPGQEEVPDSGVDRVTCFVKVYTRMGGDKGETLAQHRTRTATVFDAMRQDNLAATLSAAVSDFYVYDIWKTNETPDQTEKCLVNILQLEAVGCASDLS